MLRLGIVGAGMIADVLAGAARQTEKVQLSAVASRRLESATEFAKQHGIQTVFDSWQAMLASDTIDAVYIATPTSVREKIAIAAAHHGKHILAEKPFDSAASLQRISAAAEQHQVALMDATHFVNHPRTAQIQQDMHAQIGEPKVVRTAFFFPFMDRSNIRFNPAKEPTGAVGDMAWYCMRAITEYLQPQQNVAQVCGSVVKDEQTGAVIRGTGIVSFDDGKSSSFDFGYDAGVCLMDLDILGETGMLRLDDYVLDWKQGFAFNHPQHEVGYVQRSGMQAPHEFEQHTSHCEQPQTVEMLNNFAALVATDNESQRAHKRQIAMQTQQLLDQYWQVVAA